ncbi:MAG: ATP-binding protein [Caulobacter sp.]|nr:ATP-binding protein [Caulobacter sp.]
MIQISEQTDRFGLAESAAARRRHLTVRLGTALLVAAVLNFALGWWMAWIWSAAYVGSQLLEAWASPRLLSKPPQTPGEAANLAVALFFPGSLVFGGLAVALWIGVPDYGPALGVAVIASAMINLIALSRGSRIAFAASATPYGLYLLVMPMLDYGRIAGPVLTAMMMAVGVIMLNIIGAWISTEEARRGHQAAAEEAERRRTEAEAAVEAKSAYLAAISHELRTPISAILAGAAELERTSPGAGRAQARLIGGAGKMMQTLLDDLLDLSKIEVGRMEVESLPFDLRAMVCEVVRMWRPQARGKGLRLRIEGARRLPAWVQSDPTRIRQVLNNLISNAIKFTATGAVTLRLSATPSADGGYVLCLAVADTGPGMTAEQMTRLFTPFDQLEAGTARKHGGSGLGLAISRELARLMGGDLTAASESGEGAVFALNLTLPATEAPAAAQAPEAVEARVLVVDDHAVNRQAISLVLAPLGIVPETAASAEEGLARLADEVFDVVLMDVYMPDMDGREATRQLRSRPGPNQTTPVIAITASATPRDWDACRAAGMDGHVAKPIEPAQLYAALEKALTEPRPLEAVVSLVVAKAG